MACQIKPLYIFVQTIVQSIVSIRRIQRNRERMQRPHRSSR